MATATLFADYKQLSYMQVFLGYFNGELLEINIYISTEIELYYILCLLLFIIALNRMGCIVKYIIRSL